MHPRLGLLGVWSHPEKAGYVGCAGLVGEPQQVSDAKGSSPEAEISLSWKDQEETHPGSCCVVEKLR